MKKTGIEKPVDWTSRHYIYVSLILKAKISMEMVYTALVRLAGADCDDHDRTPALTGRGIKNPMAA